MDKILIKKITFTLLLSAFIFLSHFNWLDTTAEKYTEQGIKRTLITYAISRSLNGVISVAQGTEVAVSPAGIGLNFAPGQILDPVNDLIERFSWIVLASGTSLGIQRIFLEISSSSSITWLLTILIGLGILVIWFYKPVEGDANNYRQLLNKALVILILVRFSIPLIAVLNEALYISYLQPKYELAQAELEKTSEQFQVINDSSDSEYKEQISQQDQGKSLLEKAERWINNTQQSLDINQRMASLKQAASDISHQVINMIVVFVVQTIIFPLLFLWILIRGGRVLIRSIN